MPVTARPVPDAIDEREAFQALMLLAEHRTGRIPPDRLVRHVLSVTARAGWPVQRAALEAALRRLSAARQDGLMVATAPPSGLGVFTTRRRGSAARPYKTLIEQIEPLRASCDCRDFVRNSLGLCKHVLTVLAEQSATLGRHGTGRTPRRRPRLPRLVWDPIRPLLGRGDWMERVRLLEWSDGARKPAARSIPHEHFRREREGTYVLQAPRGDDTLCRLEIAEALLQAAARGKLAVDPPLLALLRHEKERRAPVVHRRPDRSDIAAALRTLKRKLYPYQREGVQRFLAAGRLLLADDMGLGKTAQAIAACHVLFHREQGARGACSSFPASLKPQWLREWQALQRRAGRPGRRRPRGRAGRVPPRTSRGFLVTNYEQVLAGPGRSCRRWQPDIVVLDEAQRIKNWATKTAAYVKPLDARFPPGADRYADGEPARRAGVDPRLGRRHGARAEVAADALARGVRGRAARGHRSAAPRHAARAALRTASCAAGAAGGAGAAARAHRHRVPVAITDAAGRGARRAGPADRAPGRRRRAGDRSRRRSSCGS